MKKIVIVFIILTSTIFYFSYGDFTNFLSSNIHIAIYSRGEKNVLTVRLSPSDESINDEYIERFLNYIDEKDLNAYSIRFGSPHAEFYVRSKDPTFLKYINTVNGPPKELIHFETYSTNAIDNEHRLYGNLGGTIVVNSFDTYFFENMAEFYLTTNGNVKMEDIKEEVLNELQGLKFFVEENGNYFPTSNFVQNIIIVSVAIILSMYVLYEDSKSDAMISAMYLEGYSDTKIFLRFFFDKLKGLIVVPITYFALFTIFIKLPIFKTVLFWEVVFGFSLIGFGVFFIVTSLIFFYIKERIRLVHNRKTFLLGGYNLPILLMKSFVLAAVIVLVFDCMSYIQKIKHVTSLPEYKLTENYYRLGSHYFSFTKFDDDEEFQNYGKEELRIIKELISENKGLMFVQTYKMLDLPNIAWLPSEYFLYYVDDNYVRTFLDPNYNSDSSTYIYIPQAYKESQTVGSLDDYIELDERAPMFFTSISDEQLEQIPSIYISLDYEDYKKIPDAIPHFDDVAVVIYSENDEEKTTNIVKEKFSEYGQEFTTGAYPVHNVYVNSINNSRMTLKKAGQILITLVISLIVMFIFFFRDFKQRLVVNFGRQSLKRNMVISLLIVIALVIVFGMVLNRFLFSEIEIPYYRFFS